MLPVTGFDIHLVFWHHLVEEEISFLTEVGLVANMLGQLRSM